MKNTNTKTKSKGNGKDAEIKNEISTFERLIEKALKKVGEMHKNGLALNYVEFFIKIVSYEYIDIYHRPIYSSALYNTALENVSKRKNKPEIMQYKML